MEGFHPFSKRRPSSYRSHGHLFSVLRMRQVRHNQIKVTIARELVGFLWELGTRIESQP
jgi:hypothetical protein